MKISVPVLFSSALLGAVCLFPALAEDETPANALLIMPSSKTAFDSRFQDFLNKNGARLINSFPPSAFIGYIPQELDAELSKKYAVRIYRDKADDMSEFLKYGERAVIAANTWNKRFQDDPPEAPVIISHRVNKAGDDRLILRWNEVMKAVHYRLEISADRDFRSLELETLVADNRFDLYKAFWSDGIHYWRVSGVLTLNTGEIRESGFSEVFTFSVSRPPGQVSDKGNAAAPSLPSAARFKGKDITWPSSPAFRYYRLQVCDGRDFSTPLLDVFADTETYKADGLPLELDTTYYMRLMGAGAGGPGAWSRPSEIFLETPSAKSPKLKRFRRKR